MPSANLIRKEILQALEQHILPALWQPDIPLGCVVPPLDFPGNINVRLLKDSVPRKDTSDIEFPLQSRWPSANLHSTHYPYFGFLYEGIADEKTLITKEQAAIYHLSKGIYAIRWQAPSVLLFPAGVPRSDGNATFWEGDLPAPPIKILWISIWPELLIHTHTNSADGERGGSHALQINDSSINSLTGLFLNEIRNSRSQNQQSAQAILLAVMLRLRNNLQTNHVKIANTSRSPIPTAAMPSGEVASEVASEVCRDAAIYIEMHLHESLSLPAIAAKVNLSPGHLNRLFRRLYGITVIHYARTQRIAAAKGMLGESSENIAEIARLVGFKRANLFCQAFRMETGLTPGQYRRQTKRNKSTFSSSR